ncbi:MAG: TolC family protein, partial [Bacteroidales bacterium]|nr:TolC family protein [Bacteroidales bacterium]
KGDASILDVNKASLNLLSATKAYQENRIEIETLNSELARLNGGKEITVEENTLQLSLLPSDFEVWFDDAAASSPELRSLEAQNALAQSSVKLAVSEWLPKISLGYVSERQNGGILQGIGGGISIPQWENHGKVKAAKAKAAAASARHEDAVNQYYNTLKNKYQRVLNLQKVSSEYRELLSGINSIDSLKKALESGAVSLVDYVLEISVWYDALVETLEAERDCKTLEAEMNSWKL